jgi:hypothetical protein
MFSAQGGPTVRSGRVTDSWLSGTVISLHSISRSHGRRMAGLDRQQNTTIALILRELNFGFSRALE